MNSIVPLAMETAGRSTSASGQSDGKDLAIANKLIDVVEVVIDPPRHPRLDFFESI